jgi:hypothetical protein
MHMREAQYRRRSIVVLQAEVAADERPGTHGSGSHHAVRVDHLLRLGVVAEKEQHNGSAIGRQRRGAMRQAWQEPPIEDDQKMNIPPEIIDLSPLRQLEEEYTLAVRGHLKALSPWWAK